MYLAWATGQGVERSLQLPFTKEENTVGGAAFGRESKLLQDPVGRQKPCQIFEREFNIKNG